MRLLLIFVLAALAAAERVALRAPSEAAARELAATHGYTFVGHVVADFYELEWEGRHPRGHAGARAATTQFETLAPLERRSRGPPTDPQYTRQWHLGGQTSRGLPTAVHVNAPAAWAAGANGTGVRVAVVDDGVQPDHADLAPAIDAAYALGVGSGGGFAPRGGATHGTACAGLVAARRDNGVCGVGVAPLARLAPRRYLGAFVTQADEARMLSYNCTDGVDVFTNSWGPPDDLPIIEGPGALVRAAFEGCAAAGRGGRGSVYVWAAGNGHGYGDAAGWDGYAASRYTIAVGAVGFNGRPAPYSEACACLLVAAPSSGFLFGIETVRAAPLGTSCMNDFGGTSAAAPQVAGVVALMLSANPALDWRGVQHVLVQAAQARTRREMAAEPDFLLDAAYPWTANAVGLTHSDRAGFGLVDAAEAVARAVAWRATPPPQYLLAAAGGAALVRGETRAWNLTAPPGELSVLETVELEVYINGPVAALVALDLVSPGGTVSRLVRPNNRTARELHWRFATVKCWGEHPAGTWTVRATARGAPLVFGELKLHLYGM
jgi:subtilisin family serine protease